VRLASALLKLHRREIPLTQRQRHHHSVDHLVLLPSRSGPLTLSRPSSSDPAWTGHV